MKVSPVPNAVIASTFVTSITAANGKLRLHEADGTSSGNIWKAKLNLIKRCSIPLYFVLPVSDAIRSARYKYRSNKCGIKCEGW